MIKIAIYGKGGIGKSTVTANLAAAFAMRGKKVLQIGCDPKADSTINLLGGEPLEPVMNFLRDHDREPEIDDIVRTGFGGVQCIETGGPTPGIGCAGRGIIATFNLIDDLRIFRKFQPDIVLYAGGCGVRRLCGADSRGICGGHSHRHFRRENGPLRGEQHSHGGG